MALTAKDYLLIAGIRPNETFTFGTVVMAMENYHRVKLKELSIIEVEGKPICKNDTPKHIQPDKEKAEQSQDGKQ